MKAWNRIWGALFASLLLCLLAALSAAASGVYAQASAVSAVSAAESASLSAAGSRAPVSSEKPISLPPVESVNETPVLGPTTSTPVRDNFLNGLGIVLWAAAVAAVVAILLRARRSRRRTRSPDAVLGKRRYHAGHRDRRRRLLGDKYYHDKKYDKK